MAPTLGHLPGIWPSANQELSCFQPTLVALQELGCVDAQDGMSKSTTRGSFALPVNILESLPISGDSYIL